MKRLNTTWRQQKKLSGDSVNHATASVAKPGCSHHLKDEWKLTNNTGNSEKIKEHSRTSDFNCSFQDTIGPDVLSYVDAVEQQINAEKNNFEFSRSPNSKRMHNGEIVSQTVESGISLDPSKTCKEKCLASAKHQLKKLKNRRKSKHLYPAVGSANSSKAVVDIGNQKSVHSVLATVVEDELYEPKTKLFRPTDDGNSDEALVSGNSIASDANSTQSSVLGDSCDRHLLSSWGLPESVLRQYAEMGITSMFPWQVECLALGNVLHGGNLVYSAPTSAGKTLVAEILVLKRVLETRKKAIIILPFVSVAREKMFYLKRLFRDAGIRVDGYMGSHYPPGGWKGVDIAICTIERANGLINRLMEEKKISQVGILVVDELHMLGDSGRGYLLELLLTKVLYLTWKFAGEKSAAAAQIVGMSATLPNLNLLAMWLHADLYKTDFRPVPLSEHVKIGNAIYDTSFKVVRHLDTYPELATTDSDHVIQLSLETITAGHAVLIFCPTKAWCENLARSISNEIFKLGRVSEEPTERAATSWAARSGERLREILSADNLQDVLSQLQHIPTGLDKTLFETIRFGVAFHHAGLTFDERDIIEAAFRGGILKVLVATTTLSSGVNLPARRVIIRSPVFLRQVIDVLSYRQMIGRAGRKGIDTEGESILICKENERSKAMNLVQSELRPIQSCLIHRFKDSLSNSMKRAVLEVVVSGVASCPEEVEHYCNCTLLAASLKEASKESGETNGHANAVQACINFLILNEFIVRHIMVQPDGSEKVKYVATPLGNAIMASSISPDEGIIIFDELRRAREAFVLENELHIVYQVTPLHVADQWPDLDWQNFFTMWTQMPEHQKKVGIRVGVEEQFLVRLARMQRTATTSGQYKTLAKHQRFYTAMALHDLVNEVPLNTVAQKYGCNRGMLQSLQQSASTFAGMVTAFCNRLGWHNMELLLAQFQKRLNFGIQRELCDLVRLPLLNGQRARILYNGDIRDVGDLARASVIEVETLLRNAGPFAREKQLEDESVHEFQERRQARCIWLTGNKGLTEAEAARVLIDSARELVQKDLGITIQWEDEVSQSQTETSQKVIEPVLDDEASETEEAGHAVLLNDAVQLDVIGKKHTVGSNQDESREISVYCSAIQAASVALPTPIESGHSKLKPVQDNVENKASDKLNLQCQNTISMVNVPEESKTLHMHVESISSVNIRQEIRDVVLKSQTRFCASSTTNINLKADNFEKERICDVADGKRKSDNDFMNEFILDMAAMKKDAISMLEVPKDITTGLSLCPKPIPFIWKEADGNNLSQTHSILCEKLAENSNDVPNTREKSNVNDRKSEINSEFGTSFLNEFSHDMSVMSKDPVLALNVLNVASASIVESFSQDELFMNISTAGVVVADNGNITPNVRTSLPLKKSVTPVNFSESFILDSQTTNLIDGQPTAVLKSARLSCNLVSSPANSSRELFEGGLASPVAAIESVTATSTPFINSLQSKSQVDASPKFEDSLVGFMANYTSQIGNEEQAEGSVRTALVQENVVSLGQNACQLSDSPVSIKVGIHGLDPSVSPEKVKNICKIKQNFKDILFGDSSPSMCADSSDEDNMGSLQLEDTSDESLLTIENRGKLDCFVHIDKDEVELVDKRAFTKLRTLNEESATKFIRSHNGQVFAGGITHLPVKNRSAPVQNIIQNVSSAAATESSLAQTYLPKLGNDRYRSAESKALGLNVSHTVMNVLNTLIDGDSFVQAKPPPKRKNQLESNGQQLPDSTACPKETACSEVSGMLPVANNSRESPALNRKESSHDRRSTEFVPPTPAAERSCVLTSTMHSKSLTLRQIRKAPLVTRPSKSFVNCKLDKVKILPVKDFADPIVDSDSSYKSTGSELDESHISDYDSDDHTAINSAKCNGISSRNEPKLNGSFACNSTSSFLYSSDKSFNINDVAADKKIFLTFIKEWKAQSKFSLCMACVRTSTPCAIGQRIKKGNRQEKPNQSKAFVVEDRLLTVVGLAVCWEAKDAYYIPLCDDVTRSTGDKNDSFSPLTPDVNLSISERLEAVKSVLHLWPSNSMPTIVAYDFKEQMSTLHNGCGISCYGPGEDPKIGYWLLEPTEPTDKSERIYSLKNLVSLYCPHNKPLIEVFGARLPSMSLGFATNHPMSPRFKAATEAVLVLDIMEGLRETLETRNLYSVFKNVEMNAVQVLLKTELTGMGISGSECKTQLAFLQGRLLELQDEAFKLAGHNFSLTSQAAVGQVLYVELGLPPNGESGSSKSTFGAKRQVGLGDRKRLSKVTKHHSTNKKVLVKLQKLHPLPGIILEWRRLSSAQHKVLMPLVKAMRFTPYLKMERMYGTYTFFTATGRMSMYEPNLQAVPRDIELNCTLNQTARGNAVGVTNDGAVTSTSNRVTFCVREAFIPSPGFKLLSADYSQLELRLLAHLCQDATLIKILSSGGDVFKNIAAKWKGIKIDRITDQQRQQAKQICYGMVYGIGARALAEQLEVEEEEAARFMQSFKLSYPGIKVYIEKVVDHCRRDGYVTTVLGRHRYLPHINSNSLAQRSKAERQAVNTTIQGSAADLIKRAMVDIDSAFKDRSLMLHDDSIRTKDYRDIFRYGARLVLQLHDELIYEVYEAFLPRVVQIIRKEMESALHLSVALPVNIKTGSNWANLKLYEF